MDHIEKHLVGTTKDKSQQATIWKKVCASPNVSRMSDILKIIARVEIEKQIKPLTKEQRATLANRLDQLNEPIERIQQRAESVILRETYGTIAFKYWLDEGEVRLATEINEELYRLACIERRRREEYERNLQLAIDERLRKYREGQLTDPKIAELAGEQDAYEEHRRKLNEIRERSHRQMMIKLARARQALREMDNETREQILKEAVARGLLKSYDTAIIEHAHLFADKLLPILENPIRPQSLQDAI